jgi:hypothetical protein
MGHHARASGVYGSGDGGADAKVEVVGGDADGTVISGEEHTSKDWMARASGAYSAGYGAESMGQVEL